MILARFFKNPERKTNDIKEQKLVRVRRKSEGKFTY